MTGGMTDSKASHGHAEAMKFSLAGHSQPGHGGDGISKILPAFLIVATGNRGLDGPGAMCICISETQ